MTSCGMAHILIVEDDINLGQVIFQELKKHNHEVELVENAEAALVRVNKYIYDLMITDLKLPAWMVSNSSSRSKVSTRPL